MYRVWSSVSSFALMLLLGACAAMLLANVAPQLYQSIRDFPLWFNDRLGPHVAQWTRAMGPSALAYDPGDATHVLTLATFVNDALMALVFAFVGKEVWEALTLKGGELRGTKAVVPLFATVGGVLGPITVYLALAALLGGEEFGALAAGWSVGTATELALAYVIGLWVFGPGHVAIRFLLLIAMADDATGFLILTLVHPAEWLQPVWLLLSLGAALTVYLLCNWLPRHLDGADPLKRRQIWMRQRLFFLPYALAGALSWYGFVRAGLNPALGLLPILPTIPHADRPYGIFAEAEAHLNDQLNAFQHGLKWPVAAILFLFALVNAGMTPGSYGVTSLLVASALIIGKPLGIAGFCWLAVRAFGQPLPAGLRLADLPALGCAAGVGLTVSMTLANAAFASPGLEEAARLGVLLSLCSAASAFAFARLGGVIRR